MTSIGLGFKITLYQYIPPYTTVRGTAQVKHLLHTYYHHCIYKCYQWPSGGSLQTIQFIRFLSMTAKEINDHAWVGCDFWEWLILMAHKVVIRSSLQQEARSNMDYQLLELSSAYQVRTYLIVPLLHSATQCTVHHLTLHPIMYYNISAHRRTHPDTHTHLYTRAHMHTPIPTPSTMSHLDSTDQLQTTHRLGKLKFFSAESIPCMLAILSHHFIDLLVSSYKKH